MKRGFNMNITVKGGAMSPEEKKIYVDYLTEKYPNVEFTEIELTIEKNEDGTEDVSMKYEYKNREETNIPFSRIARITGYLTTMSRTNDAKTAEINDRVKHGLCPGGDC